MNKKEAIEGINDKLKDLKYYAKEIGEVLKSTNYFIDELEKQVKKVEQKPKAYHVKDEYSFNCLMKELDEQGYVWRSGNKTTDLGAWHNVVIYLHDDKKIAHGSKREYDIREYKNYDLVEYKKEPPRFYAKIKGWELTKDCNCYWYKDENPIHGIYPWTREEASIYTKEEWAKLGIDDSNADFEEVVLLEK